ncbi:sn-glycerol-3-phosphate ABC transporter ATP-binding protein UgpC [Eubacteriales bacterium OttesenSCG-928-N14]|nr:sn-glycerol-3-phosphate ABC transporter ATP-binding protein UgpC [Eubacteriales bacterium OttesenSCG-928-N14]
MAKVTLKHIQKIYPAVDEEKPKRKKKDDAPQKEAPNLRRVADGVLAVDDFNLEIADKEFVVLVGPSGCGKSTTLRMIAGLEDITSGELYIGDELVNDVAPKDRDIAMVFQNYALYPHMTVYENMAFGLKLRKVPKDEIKQIVNQTAEILGITDLLRRKPKALSGGQRQRVAIGRAIVRQPQVFLMDEPLSNLDAKLRNQMRAELIELRKRINTTFVYVTHDQTEAMTLGDRIVIMKDGVIQQVGTPQQVFTNPSNLFVAGFIGTPQMNFFPAELIETEQGFAVLFDGHQMLLPPERQEKLRENGTQPGAVIMGIRPEHLELADAASPDSFSADSRVSEMMGSEVYVHFEIANTSAVLRVATIDLHEHTQTERFSFTIPVELIHLFDKQSENSLFA